MTLASLIARARTFLEALARNSPFHCAGGCGVESRALCNTCRARYLRTGWLGADFDTNNDAALRWHDVTSRELARRGAPDITARCVK